MLMTVPTDAVQFRFGKQSIIDSARNVYGHELLYRPIDELDRSVSGEVATARVLSACFTEVDLSAFKSQNTKLFINMTKEHLMNIDFLQLPTDLVVYEILEDTIIDDHLIARLQELNGKGYRFALDDYTINRYNQKLIPLVSFIKLDVRALPKSELEKQAAFLKRHAPSSIKLIAEKIESKEEFEYCQRLGFNLFQGFYFDTPESVNSDIILNPGSLNLLKLQNRLLDPKVTFEELADKIAKDPILAYKLLRFLGHTKHDCSFDSLKSVIQGVGLIRLRVILQLFSLSQTRNTNDSSITRAMMSAYTCQQIATHNHLDDPGKFFLAGLLSELQRALNISIKDVLAGLPVRRSLKEDILNKRGELGEVITTAKQVIDLDLESSLPVHIMGQTQYMQAALSHQSKVRSKVGFICQSLSDRLDER